MSTIGALLCLSALLAVAFTWGWRWKRRGPSLLKIRELRDALAMSMPPQFVGQMAPADFHKLLEEQLRTYLQFAGDLTPPAPFQRARATPPVEYAEAVNRAEQAAAEAAYHAASPH